MKILAIRGHNLASLPTLDLPLATGPLANAGTFAICGPTGAGKTTIFDALCLALFGRTPRYKGTGHALGGGGSDGDEKDLERSNDPRGILRRGTGEGWAEADFIALDGKPYRAVWTVARANKKPRGKLQPARQTITPIIPGEDRKDAKPTHSGAREVADWVQANVGLSLEQFMRSVLLPQGDFAAFLEANVADRAELLEKVTDSRIYRRIGKAAFDEGRCAEAAYATAEAERGAIDVMTDEARAATEERRAEAATAAHEANRAVAEAAGRVAWFAEEGRLQAALAAATAALADARVAWTEAASLRSEAARNAEADTLRPAVNAANDAELRATGARKTGDDATAGANAGKLAAAEAAGIAERAEVDANRATAALAAARPDLQAAALCDARIGQLDTAASAATAGALAAENEARAAATEAEAARSRLAALRADLDGAVGWLAAHPAVATLAAEWTLAEKLIGDVIGARAEAARLVAERGTLSNRVLTAQEALNRAETALATAAAVHSTAEATLLAADANVQLHPTSGVAEARAALDLARAALDRLASLARDAEREATDAQHASTDAGNAHAVAAEQARQAEAAAASVADNQIRLTEAERMRDRARQTADQAVHRATLVDGEPCSLCGALDHPFAAAPPVVDTLLAELEDRVATLSRAIRAETEVRTTARTLADSAVAAAAAATLRRDAHANAIARITAAWRAEGRSDAPSPSALDPDQAGLAALNARVGTLDAACTNAQRHAEAARKAESAARAAREAAERLARAATQAAQEVASAVVKNTDAAAAAARRDEEALASLAPLVDGWTGWRGALDSNPSGFRSERQVEVRLHRAHAETRAQTSEQIGRVDEALAGLNRRRVEKDGVVARALAEAASARQTLQGARSERAGLLAGEAVAVAEARLAGAETTAIRAATTAKARAARAESASAALHATANAAMEAAQLARDAALLATSARDQALDAGGFTLPDIVARLSIDPDTRRRETESLAGLQRALDGAQRDLDVRTLDLAPHRAGVRPDGTAAEAQVARDTAQESLTAHTRALGALDEALRRDDAERARKAGFSEKLAPLEQTRDRWRSLVALVGDSEGNKFSKFAQSITLDVLLARANQHLKELAPRYRLQRVPGLDLDLQVIDGDNADEVRSLASLSGGETFLASLALALGLASITSKNLRIGSLFIDEGFGTLDPATLALVVTALQGLHATGRQVGVISHVEGLAEQLGAWVSVEKRTATRSEVRVGVGRLTADD